MNSWYYAFFIGLAGSWHCAIMCGPIMQQIEQRSNQTGRMLIYTMGRLSMYGILGFFVAKMGSIWLFPTFWHLYYLFAGIILLLVLRKKLSDNLFKLLHRSIGHVLIQLGKRLGAMGYFFLGMSNGLVPCGLVLGGLSIALLQSNAWLGALSMVTFGIATLPALKVSIWGLEKITRLGSVFQFMGWGIALILLFRSAWGIAMTQSTYLQHSPLSPIICHPFS
ncbi:sulfite exporter TauE/SafE family protein [Aquirufa sp.]|jgi:sulfite exporter TauE/SafE|uniref:sulfite exporter TauE/SafE family protein n=1 Tax=Aquirufa sp. TaxID=2676249 RepID=UPI0037C0941D